MERHSVMVVLPCLGMHTVTVEPLSNMYSFSMKTQFDTYPHRLQTPNEGINQKYLKIGPTWQANYASAVPKTLGLGLNFSAMQ